jgi:hypothetical protein
MIQIVDVPSGTSLDELATWGRNARRRVHDEFLVFNQVSHWLRLLARRADET